MKRKKKGGTKKTCAWCHKPTTLPAVYAADTPLMDWLEEKIDIVAKSKGITRNEIWGENSDWATIGLSAGFENELLAYDSLLCTVTRKTICKSCLVEDYKLWLQYYSKIDDDPNDIDVIIDDLN